MGLTVEPLYKGQEEMGSLLSVFMCVCMQYVLVVLACVCVSRVAEHSVMALYNDSLVLASGLGF